MSVIRLRCSCKKIIVENDTKYTFVLNDYNQYDAKKILDREIFMFKNHIEHMAKPECITKIKSFVNSQECGKEEMSNPLFVSRQIFTLVTKLNDLTVKSNVNIARLIDTVNNSGKYDIILYVKLHKNIQSNTLISSIDVCGVEVPTKVVEITQTNKIIGMIKQSRKSTNDMI